MKAQKFRFVLGFAIAVFLAGIAWHLCADNDPYIDTASNGGDQDEVAAGVAVTYSPSALLYTWNDKDEQFASSPLAASDCVLGQGGVKVSARSAQWKNENNNNVDYRHASTYAAKFTASGAEAVTADSDNLKVKTTYQGTPEYCCNGSHCPYADDHDKKCDCVKREYTCPYCGVSVVWCQKNTGSKPPAFHAAGCPIEQQRGLFALLGDVEQAIGVRLTESFLMIPNKTTSGILFPTEADFRSCEVCHRENCPARHAPFN